MNQLNEKELESVKRSFFNILALFLGEKTVQSKYVSCLLKWSAQLNLSQEDLRYMEDHTNQLKFKEPENKVEKIEAIYHLVHMIYLDNIVEDIELEVATIYTQKLGIKPFVVGELFKAIATAPYDGKNTSEVRNEVQEFLKMHDVE